MRPLAVLVAAAALGIAAPGAASAATRHPGWPMGAGDVDGDGLADVVRATSGRSATVVFGHAPDAPARSLELRSARKVEDASLVGDLTGDGLDDVALAVPGGVRLIAGRAAADPVDVDAPGAAFGSVTGTPDEVLGPWGDIDGDGTGDLVVDDGDRGPVVVYGRAAGLDVAARRPGAGGWAIHAGVGFDEAPGVLPIGDVNGDGRADLSVIATPLSAGEADDVGFVLLGARRKRTLYVTSRGIALDRRGRRLAPGAFRLRHGLATAALGDWDGDGLDDVAIPGDELVGGVFPSARVLFGARRPAPVDLDGKPGSAFTYLFGAKREDGAFIGADLTAAGDLDGDGLADGVSVTEERGTQTVRLVAGRSSRRPIAGFEGGPATRALTLPGKPECAFGHGVGDVDGDARPDVLVEYGTCSEPLTTLIVRNVAGAPATGRLDELGDGAIPLP